MPYRYRRDRPTIGVLGGWQFYNTATTLNYLAPIFRGISRAAQDLDCNVLFGCGMGPSAALTDPLRPAWPTLSPDVDFVPIGPWNTDGLIIANPLHSKARAQYVQDLIVAGCPVMFIGSGEPGPTIVADNAGGILEAMQHLLYHGHQRIAFIAGSPDDMEGDTGDRLRAYLAALSAYGLKTDWQIVGYGRHVYDGGYSAMQQILASGAVFTAVLSSNDESAMGAMQALKENGRRIPQDVAIIGFDNRPEGAVQEPALSSVRVPLFHMGYSAVKLLRERIDGQAETAETTLVPAHLIVRESCGCGRKKPFYNKTNPAALPQDFSAQRSHLAETIASSVASQAQNLEDDECQSWCQNLVDAFAVSAEQSTPSVFQEMLEEVLRQTVSGQHDTHIWQAAISILGEAFTAQPALNPPSRLVVEAMLDQARITISARMQRQLQQHVVDERQIASRLSILTAKLLTALDEDEIFEILAQQLPGMDIHTALIALFEADGDEQLTWGTLRNIIDPGRPPIRFLNRAFPPDDLSTHDSPFSLVLVPLVNPYGQLGFVVFDTSDFDLYGAIVQQLAGALHTAQLYREAIEGRRLAEEANLMKSRFLSTVGHELRTPLNLIVGLSGVLLQESKKSDLTLPETFQNDVGRIHAHAQHLGGLIGDVLDLASSDARQLRLTNDYVDLGQALLIVAETGRQLAADKGLTWHSALPESGPWVWGDRTRLRQIALNLINNAIKFTAHGDITLRLEADTTSVTVSVQDTGLGVSPAEQSAIFDEFHRSEQSISRGYSGLGLGLAICKRLIEMHNGTIGVRSSGQEGTGSTFYFTLPTVRPPVLNSPQPFPLPLNGQRILLLTSPTNTSERLCDQLIRRGFEVHIALMDEVSNWESLLSVSLPDAVVLDVSATSDKVWNVFKTAIDNPAMQGTPVLFYTSSQESGLVLEMDYLTKPIRLAEFKQALDRHLPTDDTAAHLTHTFLIVDDDSSTLAMHARIVQSQSPSNRVFMAQSGREALNILRSAPVSLVLLDLMMPEMDGFDVLEAMREQESTRDIPVIVLTGRVLTEADMARLNQGAAKVLSKGMFSIDETLAHISAVLERKRRLSSEAQRLVRQAMIYLHKHFAEPISRRDIAQHVGLAEDHLTLCFRQELGITPIAYLNRYRVNQAKRLLKDSQRSITEIALEVGFSDSGYFSRVFRRQTGLSPEVYRRT